MAITALTTIKDWFRTYRKPTQTQFWSTFDSFFHKEEKIPTSSIDGLDTSLADSASLTAFNQHLLDEDAHNIERFTDQLFRAHIVTNFSVSADTSSDATALIQFAALYSVDILEVPHRQFAIFTYNCTKNVESVYVNGFKTYYIDLPMGQYNEASILTDLTLVKIAESFVESSDSIIASNTVPIDGYDVWKATDNVDNGQIEIGDIIDGYDADNDDRKINAKVHALPYALYDEVNDVYPNLLMYIEASHQEAP